MEGPVPGESRLGVMAAHRLFGIRHHGPGCARALKLALESFEPDCVLLEGPPDAESALALLTDAGLRPPVALLIHDVENPSRAVFYPFVVFSPEWQALRYATDRGVPARFIDLPISHALALRSTRREESNTASADQPHSAPPAEKDPLEPETQPDPDDDPIALLAEAAGFRDHEQWWDVQVEQRRDVDGLFEAIAEAMTELRRTGTPRRSRNSRREVLREAHMRVRIRKAKKEGFQRIAVVCGAWHIPALAELGGGKQDAEDRALLKGLAKVKVASTWIPWTHSRLSFRSGYGAGVDSPGWYAHVWEHGARAPAIWIVRAARLLRSEDLDVSSANVIESVRLAEALAVLRELPSPGLTELREAILTVLCGGEVARLTLIRERLEVGDELGAVPENAAQVPLQRDFEREVKRLRLKLAPEPVTLELDLRKENDRDKSRLLHRLRVLGVEWAEPLGAGNTAGTFRELWRLEWDPELTVNLVAANLYGNTVPSAAQGKLSERAAKAPLPELATLIELSMLADLPDALTGLLVELDARAAQSGDVELLLDATDPLARVIRYGDVRGSRAATIQPVFTAILERAIVALPAAATRLDDDGAARLLEALQRGHSACLLLGERSLKADWLGALDALCNTEAAHPRIRGRACRFLVEQNELDREELERRARLALSTAVEPANATRWLEGLIAGDGLFLVHHETLIDTLDAWLAALTEDVFAAELPLLRRAFAGFATAERRALARRIRRSATSANSNTPVESTDDFDAERARQVLPVLATILGVDHG